MSRRRASANKRAARPRTRCAIYTRKSSDEGLQQEFNSLDASARLRKRAEQLIGWLKASADWRGPGWAVGSSK